MPVSVVDEYLSAMANPGTPASSVTAKFQPAAVCRAVMVASPRLRPLCQFTL